MVKYIFESIFLIIDSGTIYERLQLLLELQTFCKIMGYDYRIQWKHSPECTINLEEFLYDDETIKRIVPDISLLINASYFFNPSIHPNNVFNDIELFAPTNGEYYENITWYVFSNNLDSCSIDPNNTMNMNMKKINFITKYVDDITFKKQQNNIYNNWEFESNIQSYINVFQSEHENKNVLCLYVNDKKDLDDSYYLNRIKTFCISSKIFVIFSENIALSEQCEFYEHLITQIDSTRCFRLITNDYDSDDEKRFNGLLSFACLLDCCKFVVTHKSSCDNYVKRAVNMRSLPFYIIDTDNEECIFENYNPLF